MNTIVTITKNNKAILNLVTTSDHLFYDNWLPSAILDLLENLDAEKGEVNVANLKFLKPTENEEGESAIVDLDKKTITLPKGIFAIVAPEKVAEENECYAVEKEGEELILRNFEPRKGEAERYVLKPTAMKFLDEKMSKVLPLAQAKEILSSMQDDAESYKRPVLLENGMVYVANII